MINKELPEYREGYKAGSSSLITILKAVIQGKQPDDNKLRLIESMLAMADSANRVGESVKNVEEDDFLGKEFEKHIKEDRPEVSKVFMKLAEAIPALLVGKLRSARYEEDGYSEMIRFENGVLTLYTGDGEEVLSNQTFLLSDFTIDWEVEAARGTTLSDLFDLNSTSVPFLSKLPDLLTRNVDFLKALDVDGDEIFAYLDPEDLTGERELIFFYKESEEGDFEQFRPALTREFFFYDWKSGKDGD